MSRLTDSTVKRGNRFEGIKRYRFLAERTAGEDRVRFQLAAARLRGESGDVDGALSELDALLSETSDGRSAISLAIRRTRFDLYFASGRDSEATREILEIDRLTSGEGDEDESTLRNREWNVIALYERSPGEELRSRVRKAAEYLDRFALGEEELLRLRAIYDRLGDEERSRLLFDRLLQAATRPVTKEALLRELEEGGADEDRAVSFAMRVYRESRTGRVGEGRESRREAARVLAKYGRLSEWIDSEWNGVIGESGLNDASLERLFLLLSVDSGPEGARRREEILDSLASSLADRSERVRSVAVLLIRAGLAKEGVEWLDRFYEIAPDSFGEDPESAFSLYKEGGRGDRFFERLRQIDFDSLREKIVDRGTETGSFRHWMILLRRLFSEGEFSSETLAIWDRFWNFSLPPEERARWRRKLCREVCRVDRTSLNPYFHDVVFDEVRSSDGNDVSCFTPAYVEENRLGSVVAAMMTNRDKLPEWEEEIDALMAGDGQIDRMKGDILAVMIDFEMGKIDEGLERLATLRKNPRFMGKEGERFRLVLNEALQGTGREDPAIFEWLADDYAEIAEDGESVRELTRSIGGAFPDYLERRGIESRLRSGAPEKRRLAIESMTGPLEEALRWASQADRSGNVEIRDGEGAIVETRNLYSIWDEILDRADRMVHYGLKAELTEIYRRNCEGNEWFEKGKNGQGGFYLKRFEALALH